MKNIKIIKVVRLISTFIVCIFVCNILINAKNVATIIILSHFLVIFFITFAQSLFSLMNNNKYDNLLKKLYTIVFLVYWFGFLSLWCYLNIININYFMLLLSVPFWLAGIYMTYRQLIKK